MVWRPRKGLRRRHVDGERVEGTPQEEVQSVRLRGRTLLSGRPARVAEGQRPDGARAGALEALDGGRGRALENNLANTYDTLGRHEEAMCLRQDVYSGRLILHGEEDEDTISSAMNYVGSLVHLRRFEEAKSLLRKWVPVARRVLGEGKILTLRIRQNYAIVLCMTASPTLNDLSEAVTTLEDTERIARRVLGGSHPLTVTIERHLREAQRERDAAAALANE